MARFLCGFVPRKVHQLYKQYRVVKYLKRYLPKVSNYEKCIVKENPYPDKIWTMWLQGYNSAPEIVKACIDSIKKYSNGREVIVLDENNVFDYAKMPQHIVEKYNKGLITKTHFSDLVRLELLDSYGGTWIDSTMYCTDNFEVFLKPDLMFFQKLRTDNVYIMSSFFMHSTNQHNYIIYRLKECLYDYWQKNNKLLEYFLLHFFFVVLVENDERGYKEWKEMPMFMSWLPQILVQEYTKEFNQERFDYIKQLCPVHKFSYKKDGFYSGIKLEEEYIAENSLYHMLVKPYQEGKQCQK